MNPTTPETIRFCTSVLYRAFILDSLYIFLLHKQKIWKIYTCHCCEKISYFVMYFLYFVLSLFTNDDDICERGLAGTYKPVLWICITMDPDIFFLNCSD